MIYIAIYSGMPGFLPNDAQAFACADMEEVFDLCEQFQSEWVREGADRMSLKRVPRAIDWILAIDSGEQLTVEEITKEQYNEIDAD